MSICCDLFASVIICGLVPARLPVFLTMPSRVIELSIIRILGIDVFGAKSGHLLGQLAKDPGVQREFNSVPSSLGCNWLLMHYF